MSRGEQLLSKTSVGEVFTGFVLVRSRELRTRRDGPPYLRLELADRSGRVFANIWDDADETYSLLTEGSIIKVQGMIERFQESRVLNIRKWRTLREDDPVSLSDLLPTGTEDPERLWKRVKSMMGTLRNPYLKTLVEHFLRDDQFRADFSLAPAGKLWHHNYLGGLLEHTVAIMRLVRLLCRLYPILDRDLLLVGAFLHDIGKVGEYSTNPIIDYTDQGRLVGHIVIGAQWVSERIAQIPDFPPFLRDHLLHLILSHQGTPAQGTAIVPKTREAFILHYADEIDSKMDAIRRIVDSREGDERWKFVKLLDRHIFVDFPKDGENPPPFREMS